PLVHVATLGQGSGHQSRLRELVREVQQDRARLPDDDAVVVERGNPAEGVDRLVACGLLLAREQIHLAPLEGRTCLCQPEAGALGGRAHCDLLPDHPHYRASRPRGACHLSYGYAIDRGIWTAATRGSRAAMSVGVQPVPRFMSHGANVARQRWDTGASAARIQVGTTSSKVVAAVDGDAVQI